MRFKFKIFGIPYDPFILNGFVLIFLESDFFIVFLNGMRCVFVIEIFEHPKFQIKIAVHWHLLTFIFVMNWESLRKLSVMIWTSGFLRKTILQVYVQLVEKEVYT